jgi:hypothetical protein
MSGASNESAWSCLIPASTTLEDHQERNASVRRTRLTTRPLLHRYASTRRPRHRGIRAPSLLRSPQCSSIRADPNPERRRRGLDSCFSRKAAATCRAETDRSLVQGRSHRPARTVRNLANQRSSYEQGRPEETSAPMGFGKVFQRGAVQVGLALAAPGRAAVAVALAANRYRRLRPVSLAAQTPRAFQRARGESRALLAGPAPACTTEPTFTSAAPARMRARAPDFGEPRLIRTRARPRNRRRVVHR